MAKKSAFQSFVRAFWADFSIGCPYAKRFEKTFCVTLPKASSFYLGVSPHFGKHVIVNFQHSPKAWEVGEFTINAHISSEFAPTTRFSAWTGFETFEDGMYRLAHVTTGIDRWWCLREKDPEYLPRDNAHGQYWEPSSYQSEDQVISEAIADVRSFLNRHLLQHAGFPQHDGGGRT
jgi:hypothetical protein